VTHSTVPRSADTVTRGADASHAARSGAVQVMTTLAQGLFASTQVIFARLYGRPVYGAYLSAMAAVDVFCRGGPGGADKAMLRYVAASRASGDEAGVRSAIGTGLRLTFAVAGGFAVALALGAPRLAAAVGEPSLAPALRILAPLPLLTGAVWVLIQATLAARITTANLMVRGIAEPALLLVAGVVAWSLGGGGLAALTTAQVASSSAALLLAALVVRRVLRPGETARVLSAPRLRGFARFSLPIAVAEMLNAVVQRADILMLATLRGAETAALYGAADLVTRTIANIRYAFDSVVAGVMSETLELGELPRLQYNLRLSTRWVVSVAAPIAVTVVVLRRELLTALFGASYAAGAGLMVALALSHFVNASFGLTGWMLVVAGRTRLGLLNNLIGAAFNLPAAYLLIIRHGIVGAGYAALGTSLLVQAVILIEVGALTKIHPLSAGLLKPMAAAVLALAAELALRSAIASGWARLAAVIATGAVVYGSTLLALGLPAEERQILARSAEALRARLRLPPRR
jgi:O-antigen/teichoic acid export membrane protein